MSELPQTEEWQQPCKRQVGLSWGWVGREPSQVRAGRDCLVGIHWAQGGASGPRAARRERKKGRARP